MELFNLRKIAMVLSFILAVTPVMDVAAAVSLSASQAATIFEDLTQSKDVDSLLTAAGVPAGTLYTSLELSFNTAATNYKSASSMTASKIQSIFSKYQTDCQNLATVIAAYQNPAISIVAGQNVAAVNNAMQDLATFMGALFPHLQDGYMNNKTSGAINGMVLPLTNVGLAMANLPAGQTADQYYANIFVNEMAAWLPIQVAETAGRNNTSNIASLALAASQLQLSTAAMTPAQAAQLMINVITAAQCSSSVTVQAQITCGISWYNNLLSTINQNISFVNTAVASVDAIFTADQKNAVAAINAATTQSTAQTALNTGIAQVNVDYKNNVVLVTSNYSKALATANALLVTLNNLPTSITGLVAAQSTLQTVINAANDALPVLAEVDQATGFTVANSAVGAAYDASMPGLAITAMNTTYTNYKAPATGGGGGGLSSADIAGIVSGLIAFTLGLTIFGLWKAGVWPKTDEAKQTLEERAQEIADQLDGKAPIDIDLLGKLTDAEFALQNPETALSDLEEVFGQVQTAISGNTAYTEIDGDINQLAQDVIATDTLEADGVDTTDADGPDRMDTFEKLIEEQTGSSLSDQADAAQKLISDSIPEGSATTYEEVLDAIGNTANFPAGTSLIDAVNLIGQALSANPTLDLSNTANLQAALEQISGSPVVNPVEPINTGSTTMPDVPNADLFDQLVAKGAALNQAEIESAIRSSSVNVADYQAQVQAIKDALDSVEPGSSAAQEYQETLAEANAAGKAEYNNGEDTGEFIPVE